MTQRRVWLTGAAAVAVLAGALVAQDKKKEGYTDTPVITGQKWKVHDALDLYNVRQWGKGYFGADRNGHLTVHPNKKSEPAIDLKDLVDQLVAREHRAIEQHVLGLAPIVELLTDARADLLRDLAGVDGGVHAAVDRKQQAKLLQIGFDR